jgi:hypothetical protein
MLTLARLLCLAQKESLEIPKGISYTVASDSVN